MAKLTIGFIRYALTEYFLDSKQYDSYEDKVESIPHKESRQVIRWTAKNYASMFNKLALLSPMMWKDEGGNDKLFEIVAELAKLVLHDMKKEGYYK